MSLIRVLHVALPDDLATHVSVDRGVSAADAVPSSSSFSSAPPPPSQLNRCVVIDPSHRTATLTRCDDAAERAARSDLGRDLMYDALVVHPHNAAFFEEHVMPALDALCGAVQGSREDPFSYAAPPCRTVLLYGSHGRDTAGRKSSSSSSNNSRAELFAELIWRCAEHVRSSEAQRHDQEASHSCEDSGHAGDATSASPASPALSTWISFANLYPQWGVGDVLDPRHAMHRADLWRRPPLLARQARLSLCMKPLVTALDTPESLQTLLRAADVPGSLRQASAALQRDHRQRSTLVCTLTVTTASACEAGGCLHLVLLPDARTGADLGVATPSGSASTAMASSRELSAFCDGLSLLTLRRTNQQEQQQQKSSSYSILLEKPLAAAAQRALKDSLVWRFLKAHRDSTVRVRADGSLIRSEDDNNDNNNNNSRDGADGEKTEGVDKRVRFGSLGARHASDERLATSLTVRAVENAIGPSPILVLGIRSAWQYYAETRSAFLFAQRAVTVPARWWWCSVHGNKEKGKIVHHSPLSLAPFQDTEATVNDKTDGSSVLASVDEVEPGRLSPDPALSIGTSAGRAASSGSPSRLTPNDSPPRPYPAVHDEDSGDDEVVPSLDEAGSDVNADDTPAVSLSLLAQKDALIVSLHEELALLRDENSRLRRRCATAPRVNADVSSPNQDANNHRDFQQQAMARLLRVAKTLFLRPDAPDHSRSVLADDENNSNNGGPRRHPHAKGGLCWRCDASLIARSDQRYRDEFLPLLKVLCSDNCEESLTAPPPPPPLASAPAVIARDILAPCPTSSEVFVLQQQQQLEATHNDTVVLALQREMRELRALVDVYEHTLASWEARFGPQLEADLAALERRQQQHHARQQQFHAEHAETVQDLDRILFNLRCPAAHHQSRDAVEEK